MSEAPSPRRRPRWHPRSVVGVWFPGQYPGDERIREAVSKTTKTITVVGILALSMRSALGMIGDHLSASTASQQKLVDNTLANQAAALADQVSTNAAIVARLDGILATQATQAAGVAVIAGKLGVRLALPQVQPHLTVVTPVTVVHEAALAPTPPPLPPQPAHPQLRPRRDQ